MIMNRIDCLGLGIMPYDVLYSVKVYPEAEMKIDADSLHMQGGGPVPTVLVGLSRLGFTTAMIGVVGDDPIGQMGIDELRQAKVNTKFITVRRNKPSAVAAGWIEQGSGRRTVVLGREVFVRPADMKLSQYPRSRLVHLDGRDMPATLKLARWAKKSGATVSFDIGSTRNDVSDVFPFVDHLVVADSYVFPFTGTSNTRNAIRKLQEFGPKTVVVTEGIKGSTGYESGKFYSQAAYKVRTIDTTGAGDAFHVGYLFGLLTGVDLAERLRLGAAVAAIKCRQPGARAGLPCKAELLKFLKSGPKKYR